MTDPAQSLKNQKAELRRSAVAERERLFKKNNDELKISLLEFSNRFSPKTKGDAVSGYVPIGTEIDCMFLMEQFYAQGFTIGLPLVTARAAPLTFLNYVPGDRLIKGDFDVMTPEHKAAKVVPALLMVPLLAYDREGYRLGYGGGFYDRTLELLRKRGTIKAIGLAFSGQEIEAVPHDDHDQPLDGLLSEHGLIEF